LAHQRRGDMCVTTLRRVARENIRASQAFVDFIK
jgi:hypothetical protein